jgi:hypothetical protein
LDDEGVKSALELALERISALPELTPQEIAEQKERENAPVGTAIAVRYLNGTLSDAELPAELGRYEGERQHIIRRALLATLVRELRFGCDPRDAQRALLGASAVAPLKKNFCDAAAKSFERILREFEADKEGRLEEFSALSRQRLSELGISGSAVRPNLDEDEEWKLAVSRIRQTYEPQLDKLRYELLQKISG